MEKKKSQAWHPSTREGEDRFHEFKTSLVYTLSCRTANIQMYILRPCLEREKKSQAGLCEAETGRS